VCRRFRRAATVAIDVGPFHRGARRDQRAGGPELDFNRDLAAEIESAARRDGLKTNAHRYDGLMSRLTAAHSGRRRHGFFLSVHHDSVQPHFLETWEFDRVKRLFSDRYSGFSLFVSRKNAALNGASPAPRDGEALRGAGFLAFALSRRSDSGENKPFADRRNGVHYYDNLIVSRPRELPPCSSRRV